MTNWEAQFKTAELMAIEAHQGQQYGNFLYHHHLQEVVNILIKFGGTLNNPEIAPILIAAWLHDSLEDTSLTYDLILNKFGQEVADIVEAVTDERGKNRKERKALTYIKTRQNEKAIILKLADRIANIRASQLDNPKKLKMYSKEQQDFEQALKAYSSSQLSQQLWKELEHSLTAFH
ncbi:HD domain-containing protein [Crocosphaera sp. XPORK-15E]|uniref:HD domain-containing protein n=1 Tax=Crocosphaera sp. XPORK-15E TaxID=3110247 RepID=UPI002B2182E4|nr:HD domain-containing protein [Crocosphaera sp. XPORK-15E]MEA5536795.1 HD domain-containing protein [Crocosphaera sp. XPORK-15E]